MVSFYFLYYCFVAQPIMLAGKKIPVKDGNYAREYLAEDFELSDYMMLSYAILVWDF